ncbi:MAG TPA: DegT/DnrJ/EryC1/StrS family aminotransferase, partial [Opitutales bacterium]|nr:DegT/DnrJ/EryC1/StrS family aminotransferase [Opitutales bacterium]
GADSEIGEAGTIGDFGAFSFFPSKNLGCLGDGGLLITSDKELAERARILRVHGMEPKYFHPYIGGNFRLDPLQAAILRVKLPHYSDYTEKRRANAEFYLERLSQLPGVFEDVATAPEENAIILPKPTKGHIWNQFTLRIRGADQTSSRRDEFRAFLTERGIGNEVYYPKTLHTQECFSETGQRDERLPRAEALARESVSIPVFPELTDAQKEEVADAIEAFVRL